MQSGPADTLLLGWTIEGSRATGLELRDPGNPNGSARPDLTMRGHVSPSPHFQSDLIQATSSFTLPPSPRFIRSLLLSLRYSRHCQL